MIVNTLEQYAYGKKMKNSKILIITDDAMEATKIIRWLESWKYAVKIMDFGNKLISIENLLKYDLILVDLPLKDNYDGIEVFNNFKNFIEVPVICMASFWEDYKIDFPKNFFYIAKPIDPKELKLTIEMAMYRHQMEKALYDSERKYKLLIENANDPIAIVKNDGTFLLVNKSGAKYLGGVPRDFNGKSMGDVFPTEQADSQMKSIRKVIETGIGLVIEEKTIINHKERWFNTKLQPITDSNGLISSVQLIARDITRNKNIELDLVNRENFFSGILNDLHSFVAVLKPTGEIIFVNNTPLEFIGKKLEDMEGVIFYETPWWDYSEEVKSSLREDIELCATGKSLSHEIQINSLHGLIWIDFSMHPVYDSNGNVKYLVPEGRDISNIKHAKKALHEEKNRFMGLVRMHPLEWC